MSLGYAARCWFVAAAALVIAAPAVSNAQEHIDQAGEALAAEILKSASGKLARRPERVMLEELDTKEPDEYTRSFNAALLRAVLTFPGVLAVEQQALEAVLEEGNLSTIGNKRMRKVMSEIAGAFGADLWIAGSVDRFGGTYRANLRAIDPVSGNVVATAQTSFTETGTSEESTNATLEIQMRILADQIAGGLDHVEGEVRYQRFAIVEFEETNEGAAGKGLGKLVSAEITTLLQRDHGVMLIERERLSEIIDELALSQTGLFESQKSMEIGRLSGANALVMGSVAEAGSNYLVNARVVETASGDVLLSEKVNIPAADLVALSSEAVVLRSKSGAFFRSLIAPGWGQFYNREPIKGITFASSLGVSLAGALTLHLIGERHASKYNNLRAGSHRFGREAQLANQGFEARNVFLVMALGIYALNVIDAVISGYSGDSQSGN